MKSSWQLSAPIQREPRYAPQSALSPAGLEGEAIRHAKGSTPAEGAMGQTDAVSGSLRSGLVLWEVWRAIESREFSMFRELIRIQI